MTISAQILNQKCEVQDTLFVPFVPQQYASFKNIAARKTIMLDAFKGKNLTYKRYTKRPLRYGGGKSLAVGLF